MVMYWKNKAAMIIIPHTSPTITLINDAFSGNTFKLYNNHPIRAAVDKTE